MRFTEKNAEEEKLKFVRIRIRIWIHYPGSGSETLLTDSRIAGGGGEGAGA